MFKKFKKVVKSLLKQVEEESELSSWCINTVDHINKVVYISKFHEAKSIRM